MWSERIRCISTCTAFYGAWYSADGARRVHWRHFHEAGHRNPAHLLWVHTISHMISYHDITYKIWYHTMTSHMISYMMWQYIWFCLPGFRCLHEQWPHSDVQAFCVEGPRYSACALSFSRHEPGRWMAEAKATEAVPQMHGLCHCRWKRVVQGKTLSSLCWQKGSISTVLPLFHQHGRIGDCCHSTHLHQGLPHLWVP